MGAFRIDIMGVGGHGCERKAKAGEKLFGRCGRFNCPDCMAYEFVQQLKQKGMIREGDTATGQEVIHSPACNPNSDDGCTCHAVPDGAEVYHTTTDGRLAPAPAPAGKTFWRRYQRATFTHWPDSPTQVVDDLLTNERRSGRF